MTDYVTYLQGSKDIGDAAARKWRNLIIHGWSGLEGHKRVKEYTPRLQHLGI